MAFSVQMPALGESVTEGTVTRWLKQEGDTVEVDEPLLEVSTDKVDTEIPSPVAGVLTKIVAQEDDTVEIGGELDLRIALERRRRRHALIDLDRQSLLCDGVVVPLDANRAQHWRRTGLRHRLHRAG